MSPTFDPELPHEISGGRYVLEELLGGGATARVYAARDTALGVDRAIKVLDAPPAAVEDLRIRLRAEARAMAATRHRHVLEVHDIGSEDDVDFVVMDLATGGSLADLIEKDGPLPEPVAIGYALQILAALAEAHSRGIIHRDVKPHNVLLDHQGLALLADFGIALLSTDDTLRATRTGVAMGTLAFMAPEQRLDARSVDATADLYAVATSLYFLIKGENPIDLFAAERDSERWEGISAALTAVLFRATRYRIEERHPSAVAMAFDLLRVFGDDPLQTLSRLTYRAGPPLPGRGTAVEGVGDSLQESWQSATRTAVVNLTHLALDAPVSTLDAPIPPSLVRTLVGPTAVNARERTAQPAPRRRRSRAPWVVAAVLSLMLVGIGSASIWQLTTGRTTTSVASDPVDEPVAALARPAVDAEPAAVAPLDVLPVAAPPAPPVPVASTLPPEPDPVADAAAEEPPTEVPPTPRVPMGEPPVGTWSGAYNGRPATMVLWGTPDALVGEVVVRFGSRSVRSEVTGTYDPGTRRLLLSDVLDEFDAGAYAASLSAELDRIEGRFEGRYNGAVLSFVFRPEPTAGPIE